MSDTSGIRTIAPTGFRLRKIEGADEPFLAEVYASTRREELAAVPWSEEQKAAFLKWQFDNQHQYYQQYYPGCEFLVIEKLAPPGAEPIGRLYVDRWPNELRIVDIALLPAYRGHGIGTSFLRGILEEGDARGLSVTIHVESNNPALSLYRRLGFKHVDSNGVYFLMRRDPKP
jgi:ribosomal protein S18 acetylase RimI-like enzyme